jgi:excisionase family DNA binding protein
VGSINPKKGRASNRRVKQSLLHETLAYSVPEACAVGGIGRTALYKAIQSGELRAVKRGRRTLILAGDLRYWLANLPSLVPL